MIKINKTRISFELVQLSKETNFDGEYGGEETIEVNLDWNNKMTIKTHRNQKDFVFCQSDPERVKRIGQLLVEAGNLKDKYSKFLEESDIIK